MKNRMKKGQNIENQMSRLLKMFSSPVLTRIVVP